MHWPKEILTLIQQYAAYSGVYVCHIDAKSYEVFHLTQGLFLIYRQKIVWNADNNCKYNVNLPHGTVTTRNNIIVIESYQEFWVYEWVEDSFILRIHEQLKWIRQITFYSDHELLISLVNHQNICHAMFYDMRTRILTLLSPLTSDREQTKFHLLMPLRHILVAIGRETGKYLDDVTVYDLNTHVGYNLSRNRVEISGLTIFRCLCTHVHWSYHCEVSETEIYICGDDRRRLPHLPNDASKIRDVERHIKFDNRIAMVTPNKLIVTA